MEDYYLFSINLVVTVTTIALQYDKSPQGNDRAIHKILETLIENYWYSSITLSIPIRDRTSKSSLDV